MLKPKYSAGVGSGVAISGGMTQGAGRAVRTAQNASSDRLEHGEEWIYAYVTERILELECVPYRAGVDTFITADRCERAAVIAEQALISAAERAPALDIRNALAGSRFARNFAHRRCNPRTCSVASQNERNAMKALTGMSGNHPDGTPIKGITTVGVVEGKRYVYGEGWVPIEDERKDKP